MLNSYTGYRQDKIDHGELIRWTKGFGAPNTEGHDVVEMFRKSLALHVSAPPFLAHPVLDIFSSLFRLIS